MGLRITLLTPPVLLPSFGPHLAAPSLSAFLKAHGHETENLDLNLASILDDKLFHALCGSGNSAASRPASRQDVLPRSSALLSVFNDHCEALVGRSCRSVVNDPRKNIFLRGFEELVVPGLLRRNPDLVGISITGKQQLLAGLTLAYLIKKARSDIHLTLGGNLVSLIDDRLLRHFCRLPYVDSIIRHEGELPLLRLAEAIERKQGFDGVPNLVCDDGRRALFNDVTPPADFTRLPAPDFKSLTRQYPKLSLPVLVSKGCYWSRCAFCDIHRYSTEKVKFRIKPVASLVAELRTMRDLYKPAWFSFISTALPPAYCRQLSDELLRRRLKIQWVASIRVEKRFDRDLLSRMKVAGCFWLSIGAESISSRIIKLMGKGPYTRSDVEALLANAKAAGIATTKVHLIPDFPTTTREEALDVVQFLEDNQERIDAVAISNFSVMEHTQIADHPERYSLKLLRGKVPSAHGLYGLRFKSLSGMDRKSSGLATDYCRMVWSKICKGQCARKGCFKWRHAAEWDRPADSQGVCAHVKICHMPGESWRARREALP